MYKDKKVLITGGKGFIGLELQCKLDKLGANVIAIGSDDCDLTIPDKTNDFFENIRPDIVFHLAADVGGIKYLSENEADVFASNILINTNVHRAALNCGVDKLINLSAANCYPSDAIAPYDESSIYNGLPAKPVTGYAYAKRAMMVHSELSRRQYGFNSINLILDSVYGLEESFDVNKARVIPANIARFCEAKEKGLDRVSCWGSGRPIREFLYVSDAVNAIVQCAELVESSDPVNIGSGAPISIKELIECIATATGYLGDIEWDTTKPDGQNIRYLSIAMLQGIIEWKPEVSIQEGINRMVMHYMNTRIQP